MFHITDDGEVKTCSAKSPETCRYQSVHSDDLNTIQAIAANNVLSTRCKCPANTHIITPIPVFIFLIPGLCNFKFPTPFPFMIS